MATRRPTDESSAQRGLVLVVEDEPAIADLLRLNLRAAGYGVEVVRDGAAALRATRELRPSALILDIGLPGIDGIEVCRRLRAENDWTPVLFVTARDDEIDRILGLELGADDYVTKPFSPRELVARLGGVLRRVRRDSTGAEQLRSGRLVVDLTSHVVTVDGVEIAFTATEFDLIAHLLRRPGVVFTREQLLSEVWGYASTAGGRTVDVHVAQVRAKLGDASPIRTVRSVGYSAERAPRESPGNAGKARTLESDR
ncbi:MAG: response regulator transcription factor [Humibacillus sp.]|nr:response regulator transcription factor [Humibacillus sp.]MDN5778318.1 response regulator transcription factor [Humibacillus sp.]